MKRILKWTVPVDDQPHEIGGGRVVHVECMTWARRDEVLVWTEEDYFPGDEEFKNDPGHTVTKQVVQIKGTGQSFHDSGYVVGSAVVSDLVGSDEGYLVWHVVSYR